MRMLGMALGMAQRAVASGARVFELLDREPRLTAPPDAPAAAGRRRARGAARRDLRLRRRRAGAARRRPRRGGRPHGRARRPDRLRQDHARDADPAPLRRATRAPCWSTASTCATSTRRRCGARWRWSPTTPSCSRPRCGDNIAYARPEASEERGRGARPSAPGSRELLDDLPDGLDTLVGERGLTLSRRPAPARGDRPRPARRAAHPDPRRRHLERRRHHREPHQGGARAR